MRVSNRRRLATGAGLLAAFVGVLVLMFLPILDGRNALEYADALYNSISKASAYFVPDLLEQVETADGGTVDLTLETPTEADAGLALQLVQGGGAAVELDGHRLRLRGELQPILRSCLEDAEAMYHNDRERVSGKYGADARQAMHSWWTVCQGLDRGLKQQRRFGDAELVLAIQQKAVEPAYNYFGIEPRKVSESLGIVACSLVFYVVYTVWFGFAILFLFEGLGLGLAH
jgi:hypothetical protein